MKHSLSHSVTFFLIDEDVSRAVGNVFAARGSVEFVAGHSKLHGRPDEVLFDYARERHAVMVTADVGIADPLRFPLHELAGIVLLRFSSSLHDHVVAHEVERLIVGLGEKDFGNLLVVEPGLIRIRPLDQF